MHTTPQAPQRHDAAHPHPTDPPPTDDDIINAYTTTTLPLPDLARSLSISLRELADRLAEPALRAAIDAIHHHNLRRARHLTAAAIPAAVTAISKSLTHTDRPTIHAAARVLATLNRRANDHRRPRPTRNPPPSNPPPRDPPQHPTPTPEPTHPAAHPTIDAQEPAESVSDRSPIAPPQPRSASPLPDSASLHSPPRHSPFASPPLPHQCPVPSPQCLPHPQCLLLAPSPPPHYTPPTPTGCSAVW